MVSITKSVYADDPAQPSRPDSTKNASIKVVNQRRISFEGSDGFEPAPIKMSIRDAGQMGLKSLQHLDTVEFVERVLAACNLHLKQMRLSTVPVDTELVEVHRSKPRERTRAGIVVETVAGMHDTVTLAMRCDEEIDESEVIGTLKMIHAVYDDESPSVSVRNLKKSLERYSEGIRAHDRMIVFGGLFAALENAAGLNKRIRGEDFDGKIHKFVCHPSLRIQDIRDMRVANNRIKHPDDSQQRGYPDDRTVFWFIKKLRPMAAKAILFRLKKVTGGP